MSTEYCPDHVELWHLGFNEVYEESGGRKENMAEEEEKVRIQIISIHRESIFYDTINLK